jgi:acetylornithine deacetylase/succinyl-diaminopimelate desuccinylase-like protein
VTVAEKGLYGATVRVRGLAGQTCLPHRSNNAIIKVSEIVHRLAEFRPQAQISPVWRSFVEAMELPTTLSGPLLDANTIDEFCASDPDPAWARVAHASTHTTMSPTVLRAGEKAGASPHRAELQVDIRSLPGQTDDEIRALFKDALGDMAGSVQIIFDECDPSSASPFQTPLWDCLQRVTSRLVPGAGLVPFLATGASDARFLRPMGTTVYGFGLFSDRLSFTEFSAMIHGDNERIDQVSLGMCMDLWHAVASDLLA